MGTLAYILLIMGVVIPFIGMFVILIGGIVFENITCIKIGLYVIPISIICLIGGVIAGGFDNKKTASGEPEIAEEKIVKVVETKKEPVIDTTIVIKNGVADTTFTYKFKK